MREKFGIILESYSTTVKYSRFKMTRTRITLGFIVWTVGSLFNLLAIPGEACTMMGEDWKPKSLENRTIMAPVVIAGTVLGRRGQAPTPPDGSGAYSAEVAVDEVYKGYPYFNKVAALPGKSNTGASVYAIGGFGPRKRCLAQVEAGQKYIMFLSAVPVTSGREADGMRLLARYDDIFGAVVEFDEQKEKRVHRVVGWRDWALWSSCSVTCGDGVQVRRRMCAQDVPDACEGAAEQSRHCNSFSCRGVKDLLQLMSLSSFPPGVRRAPPRRRAYHVSSNAVLKLPISAIYPGGFPDEFSILLVFKPPRYFSSRQNGYLYAMLVTDPDGGLALGVQLSSSPALVHSRRDEATGKLRPDAVSFPDYRILRRKWNVLAFSVRRGSVTLHAECSKTFRVELGRNERIRVGDFGGSGGDISIGNPKPNMIDMYFEGDLEQLMLIDDPDAAALQCSSPMITHLSESSWPFINITNDLQGDMDSPFHLPIADDKAKPRTPIDADNPLIKSSDPPTTPTDAPDPAASTNQRLPGGGGPAPERDSATRGTSTAEASEEDAPTTSLPFYNENNFDFIPAVLDNLLPNYGGITSSPPVNIKFDSGNDVLFMPETELDDIPATLGTNAMSGADDERAAETPLGDVPTSKVALKTTSPHTNSPPVGIERGVGHDEIPVIDLPTAPPTSLPTVMTTIEPSTVQTALPTKATSTVHATTRYSKHPADTTTVKLRLESAHRPDSWEVGYRAPYNEPGSAEQSTEALENWSTWSTCSRTCGTGTRYRFSRCRPGSRLRDCRTGRGIAAQTQTCHHDNCRVPSLKWSAWSMCSRTCGDGVEMRMAYCYDNRVPGCDNGQKIVVERKMCRRRHCFDVCKPSCKHGGICRPDRTCACPSGYLGNSCETELCSQPCQHGGQCVAKNFCLCPSGYKPPRCTPVCNPRCQNGGTCKAPFECACPAAFAGPLCESAACSRPCQHGGTCTGPDTCSCRAGYQGQYCEQAVCAPACKNGGTCTRPGFCRCPAARRGPTCQIAYCRVTCRNGGRCSGPDTCSCAAGFGGAFCQRWLKTLRHSSGAKQPGPPFPSNYAKTKPSHRRRHYCKLRSTLVSYQRSYVKPVARTVSVKCGHWQPVLCTQTRMEYEVAYRTFYRIAYRRQCSSDD